MAQYYQIQNLDDLKQIYTDVQVVHVASEDVGVSNHSRSQQLLLPDDQLMLNDGQQVVYQTSGTPTQPQYQQQATTTTTQYIIGDEISQQQQHQPTLLHQHQPMDHHQQQQLAQQQSTVQQQQHYGQDTQQMTQEHHQLQQHQPQPQLYYTTEQILQPSAMVQHASQQELQQQQQQQQLHVQHQQQQQQYQQQQIVHQQHTMQTPQQQSIVYRMQSQQTPTQQTQMLNNAHVILQQPSGQQVLIQSPQHQDIIMRQALPQQRIIYNTNRVLYSPQQQPQQTQTILQQTASPHQQPQQHIQLQTASPMHTPTRLVQTRVAAAPQEQQQQQQQQSHQQLQQSVVFHQIQAVQGQQLKSPIHQQQQQQQMQIQQQQQQLVSTSAAVGGSMRGTIRGKMPVRGGGGVAGSGAHTLIARIPNLPAGRAARPSVTQAGAGAPRAPRSRGGTTAASPARSRGAARGGRGGTLVGAGRGTQVATTVVSGGNLQTISQQQQALIQNAMTQGKNITILNQQGQVKHIYRTVVDPQQQQQLVNTQQQQQQRAQQVSGTPRFRSPPMAAVAQAQQLQSSPSLNSSSSSGTSPGSASGNNLELDLEDSIQAVVVKKDQQKAASVGTAVPSPMGTTLTTYYAKEDDDNNRMVRTQNGTCITLAEYKKRHLPVWTPTSTTSTATAVAKMPMRAGGPPLGSGPTNQGKVPTHSLSTPVARVAPQQQQQAPQQQPQPGQGQGQGQQSQQATPTSSAVHRTSHNNYEIQTLHVLQNRSGQQIAEKDRNSAKMLVVLVSGEQRLITFTLPRESCTVQDLLEQVGVPFDSTTTIQCVENPGANIDFVVTVGFSGQESASELISRAEQSLQMSRQQESGMATSAAAGTASTTASTVHPTAVASSSATVPVASSTAQSTAAPYSTLNTATASTASAAADTNKEATAVVSGGASVAAAKLAEEVPRKIIQGFYAICQSCGFSGYDHAKCERCRRVFQEPPKRVPCVKNAGAIAASNEPFSMSSNGLGELGDKKRSPEAPTARGGTKPALTYTTLSSGNRGRGGAAAGRGRATRSGRRAAEAEPVILTLSSDEEEDDEALNKESSKVSASTSVNSSGLLCVTYTPLVFEPMMPDRDETPIYADFQRDDVTDLSNCSDKLSTALQCKLIRIGTYRFEPQDPVKFTSKGICIVAPLVGNPSEHCALQIHKREVVKIIAHFSKAGESMLCFYTLRTCAQYIKTSLQMKDTSVPLDGAAYFSANGPYQVRKIILQFASISDQARNVIKSIWNFCDEISDTDAQDLLLRAAEADRQLAEKALDSNTSTNTTTTQLNPNEIRQLLIYPAGKGGISINTEDYLCLATDQYLNDIIIDFYLKWVHNNVIPATQREKTFIFSTFFYKRLTTLTRHHQDRDVKQTAAQKRHARVQNWTKNVNLFEKDFVIIPINEQSHWFLAIICFPTLKGPVTFDTHIPVEPQQIKKQKGKKVSLQIGNTTITPLTKRDSANVLPDVCGVGDEDSERDEAEGDESDLASEDSNLDSASGSTTAGGPAVTNNTVTSTSPSAPAVSAAGSQPQAIKQPLILIFDSLAGASRSRVVATLRDYLTCEYRVKLPDAPLHAFNRDNMPGHCVKVPQQNNFTDCGLYLLQYVEQFFKDPIRDYRLPIKQLSNWFDTLTVTRKREDISLLLQKLMDERNGPSQQVILPDIPFPTQNGQLVEPAEGYNIEFEEEEMGEDIVEEDEEHVTEDGGGDADMEERSTKTMAKVSAAAAATTAVVPTQGRKIVVKRRMQVVSVPGNNNKNSGSSSNNSESACTGTTPSSGRQSMVKMRKVEQ